MHHDPPLDGGAECAAARLFGGVHRHGYPGAGADGDGRGRAAHGRVGRGVRAQRVHRAGRPRRDGYAGAGKAHLRHRDLRRGGELLHRGRRAAARMAAPPAQRPARRAAGAGGPHHDGGRAAAPARAQRAGAGGLRRRAPADGRGAADRDRADERRPAAAAPRGAEQHGRGKIELAHARADARTGAAGRRGQAHRARADAFRRADAGRGGRDRRARRAAGRGPRRDGGARRQAVFLDRGACAGRAVRRAGLSCGAAAVLCGHRARGADCRAAGRCQKRQKARAGGLCRARKAPAQLRRAGCRRYLLSGGGTPRRLPRVRRRHGDRAARRRRARGCARASVRDARAAAAKPRF